MPYGYQPKRDAHGRRLNDRGEIMGDFRIWKTEDRPTREAAIDACLATIAGTAPLSPEIGSNAIVAIQIITAGCTEPWMVMWASLEIQKFLGENDATAFTLRVRALRMADEQAAAVAEGARAAHRARSLDRQAWKVTK